MHCPLTAACKRQFADKVPSGMGFLPQWVTRKHVGGDHLGEIWGAYWVTHDRNILNVDHFQRGNVNVNHQIMVQLRRTCYITVSSSSFPLLKSRYMLVVCVGVLRCCPSLLWCFASSLVWQPVPSRHLIHSIQLPTRRERQSPGETFGANSMRSCGDLKPHGFSCRSFYLL